MSQYKSIVNPHSGKLQIILDEEFLATRTHEHTIQDIIGLQTLLSSLLQDSETEARISGMYFAK